MSTPDYMKLWHAALGREANLERELEESRRHTDPVPDVDPQQILKALASAQGEISDARAYIREMEDTISHLHKMARVRTALQRDVAESSRKRRLDARGHRPAWDPTDAEIEAAARALARWDGASGWGTPAWNGDISESAYRHGARKALIAARETHCPHHAR